ncbi:MAG: hypothetical protein AAFZ52_02345 [Bacteroidota bacterium]
MIINTTVAFFLLLCFGGTLAAQSDSTTTEKEPWFAWEATAGANLLVARSPRSDLISARELDPGPGLRFGLTGVFLPEDDFSLLLGANFIMDRGTVKRYRVSTVNLDTNSDELPELERAGRLAAREEWLRFHLTPRVNVGDFFLDLGMALAFALGDNTATFNYEQILRRIEEPITGSTITFPAPIVTIGQREISTNRTVGSLYLGAGYRINPRFFLRLEYERNLVSNLSERSETAPRRARVGVVGGYKF